MSTHPTAEEIAKEAIDKIDLMLANDSDIMAGAAAQYSFDKEAAKRHLLTAARRIAAQMVRDIGAVEALKLARLHTPSEEDYIIDAALAKLRAITQP